VIQSQRAQKSGLIHPLSGIQQESKRSAHARTIAEIVYRSLRRLADVSRMEGAPEEVRNCLFG
jgi:hypothetical protein